MTSSQRPALVYPDGTAARDQDTAATSHPNSALDRDICVMVVDVNEVEVVLINNDRVTLRVGDTFLKVDADQDRTDREVEAINLAPVPTPEILWRESPVLALAALPGRTLGRVGEPSAAPPSAWAAAGATLRLLHDAPLPPWPGTTIDELASRLAAACEWLLARDVLPVAIVRRNRQLAEQVHLPWTPVFIHGDLHLEHLFVEDDAVTGIIDWSNACQGDATYDIASLTLGNEDHLDALVAGYGELDRDRVRSWWSWRCLVVIPWLAENGYGEPADLPEAVLLRSLG